MLDAMCSKIIKKSPMSYIFKIFYLSLSTIQYIQYKQTETQN